MRGRSMVVCCPVSSKERTLLVGLVDDIEVESIAHAEGACDPAPC